MLSEVKLHRLLVASFLQKHASHGLVQTSCKKQLLHCGTHVYYPLGQKHAWPLVSSGAMMSILNEATQLLPLRLWCVCKQYCDSNIGASAG